jgi:transcriptional regulator with XRE-family HTH domain
MSDQIKSLIDQLIAAAKARGLSQAQLAEMSGLTAVGLSKAKTRGDIRASTLEKLAAQFDLELALVPRRSKDKAAGAIKAGTFFRAADETPDKKA